MKVAGVVCEYNPFHLGHQAHLSAVRRELGEDTAVLCVMSGSFVQRGEAAVLRKHARGEMALRGGANLVVELPVPWAIASAERFALGAVSVLEAAGVTDVLAFGSECGDPEKLFRAARALMEPETEGRIRLKLGSGASYASIRESAVRETLGEDAAVLRAPNDLLAVEYLKALSRLGSSMTPLPVRRIATAHDGEARENFAPASFIRGRLLAGENAGEYLPEYARDVFARETREGRAPVTLRSGEAAVLGRLRTMTEEEYAALPDASEGLWRRLREAGRREPTVDRVLEAVKTRRYAHARLRRMVLAAYLGIRAEDQKGLPPYIRVLAFDDAGRELLRRMRSASSLPVITKPAAARRLPDRARRIFELEARAGDLYALLYPDPAERRGGGEWTTSPVRLEESVKKPQFLLP